MRLGVRAPLCSLTGYAEWAREVVKGLHELGVKIALEVLDKSILESSKKSLPEEFIDLIEELESDIPENGVVLNLCTPSQYAFDTGRLKIGLGLFEAYLIPQQWLVSLNRMDMILTLSEFNREIFTRCGISRDKIELIPPAIDCSRFHPDVRPPYLHNTRPFTILFVGQLILRKGWDKLLVAALQTFRAHDDVCVFLKLPPIRIPQEKDGIANSLKEIKQLAGVSKVPIYYNFNPISVMSLPRIYQLARKTLPGYIYRHLGGEQPKGVFALPSLGEGIGLPYLEAQASGLLTLGTASTGQEFLNPENAVIVRSGSPKRDLRLEIEHTLYRGAPFPSVTVDSVSDALLRAYNLSEEERNSLELKALEQAKQLTYKKCAERILKLIQERM